MTAVQKDVYSAFHRFLARRVVAAYDRRGVNNPALADAVRELRNWDGQMERGPAPFIATLLYLHVRRAIGERASPGKGLDYDTPMPAGDDSIQMAPAAVEDLLTRRPKEWFDDYDQLLLRSFVDAMEEGRRMAGRNLEKWDWGRANQLAIVQPVVSRIPWIGKSFNIGPVAQSGSTTSVKQTTQRLGPSMRTAVDLGELDRSTMNLVAGESGHVLSSHYKDQFDAWYAGRSFPMQFQNIDVKATLVLEPR
jgi:penicillin amidase